MSKFAPLLMNWLLEGDPAIRWQALRDLSGASEQRANRERVRVAREGWGARLLALQEPSGQWGGGLCTPKWMSTTYTLLLLRDFGLSPKNPQARQGRRLLLDEGLRRDGGINYGAWGNRGETCVTGMVLSLLACFGISDERLERIVGHLLERQMKDGGWNCRLPYGATHASFHTTILVLEGLRAYEKFSPKLRREVRQAQARGREFLLVHRLFRSHRTGEIVKPVMLRFAFPPRWHYDVLRALDYFQECGAERDDRLREGIELVESKQQKDGRWLLDHCFRGKTHFELEKLGAPSRWNTLRALRVLRYWRA